MNLGKNYYWWFDLNPYDCCVANKTINGKQCTLAWYVDDNILSHKDSTVVDEVLATIKTYFPGLVIERGKQLNYLGMEIDFFDKKRMKLGTVQYIQNMIEELQEEFELQKFRKVKFQIENGGQVKSEKLDHQELEEIQVDQWWRDDPRNN